MGRTGAEGNSGHAVEHFNSLAPCGANRDLDADDPEGCIFQLTRPVWGEPQGDDYKGDNIQISTHSPRVGRTSLPSMCLSTSIGFQLTRPVWGEPIEAESECAEEVKFQLTRPVWGEPYDFGYYDNNTNISTHSPRVGRTMRATILILNCG